MNKVKPNAIVSCVTAFCKKILTRRFAFDSFVVYETGSNRFFAHVEGTSELMLWYYS